MKNEMLLGAIAGAIFSILIGIYIYSTYRIEDPPKINAEKKLIYQNNVKDDSPKKKKFVSKADLYFKQNLKYFKKAAGNYITNSYQRPVSAQTDTSSFYLSYMKR